MKRFSLLLFTFLTFAGGLTVSATSPKPTVTPAPGNFPGPLSTVTLTFEGVSDIQFSDRALNYYDPSETVDKTGVIYFGGDEIDLRRDMYVAEIEGNEVMFTPTVIPEKGEAETGEKGAWDILGKYQLSIPAGAITMMVNGHREPCPELNYTWVLSDLVDPVITPGKGAVDDISTVKLFVPDGFVFDGGYIRLIKPSLYNVDYKGNATGTPVAQYQIAADALINDVSEIDLINPTKPNSQVAFQPKNDTFYIFTLPYGCLRVKNQSSGNRSYVLQQDVLWHYVDNLQSEVKIIENNDAIVSVYSLDGQLLIDNKDRDELNKLPKGVYIINGKMSFLK